MPLLPTLYPSPHLARLGGQLSCALLLLASTAHAQAPTVTGVSPARNARSAPRTTNVAATFNQALGNTAATQGALKVFSQQAGGKKTGVATVSGNTLTFDPGADFKAGETVSATVTAAAQSSNGAAITPHVFQFTTAVSSSSGTFSGGSEVTAGNGGFAFNDLQKVGDVDGDGDLDLLVINSTTNAVSVRLNNGAGTFSGNQEVAVTAGPYNLALGDLDADGDLDFVVMGYISSNDASTISVHLNNAGSFAAGPTIGFTTYVREVATGDVDGDGDLDLVTDNLVFTNNGNATFSNGAPTTLPFSAYKIEVVDVDNDGDLDLVGANYYDDEVAVRLNNGRGVFSGTRVIAAGGNPTGLVAGDIDGDGDLDILVSGAAWDPGLHVCLNDGAGNFTRTPNILVNRNATLPALHDLDGDGDLDLVVTAPTGATLGVHKNNGAGVFSEGINVPVNSNVRAITLGDVDGDGDLDILGLGQTVSVRLNQAAVFTTAPLSPTRNARSAPRNTDVAVTFTQAPSNTPTTQQALRVFSQQAGGKKAGTATVSGNNLAFNPTTDFKAGETVFATVTTAAQSNTGQSLTRNEVFQFTAATTPSAGLFTAGSVVPTGTNPGTVSFGDVDGDGDLDLATSNNNNTGSVSIRLNNGNATFTGSSEVAVGILPRQVVFGDVDGDGDLDLFTVNVGYTINYAPSTVSVRLNNGNGSFGGGSEVTFGDQFGGGTGKAIFLGDIDGDSDLDFVATSNVGIVAVCRNNGNGTFAVGRILVGNVADSAVLGDIDNDGDLDLLVSEPPGGRVYVCPNDGNGSFAVYKQIVGVAGPGSSSATGITLGDVDADGDLDLVAIGSQTVSIRRNEGGTFYDGQEVAVNGQPSTVALADADGDGDLDLLATTANSTVSVRLNNGSGTFSGNQNVSGGGGYIALGDLDNNGTLDFAFPNAANAAVAIRLNSQVLATVPAQLAEQVSLYPNPAHASVYLRLPIELARQSIQLQVLNTLGQVVLEQKVAAQSTLEVHLPKLAAGVYNVRLGTSQGVVNKRLLIN